MTKSDIAGLVAPVLGGAVLIAAHYLSASTMTEIMFWAGVLGGALVGVANRYATPPKAKSGAPLVPPGLNSLFLILGIFGTATVVSVAGCSALTPALAPSAEAVTCVVLGGISGESVTKIAQQCGGLTEEAVAQILNDLLAKDLGLPPPDGDRAAAAHALTPLQRANIGVSLHNYDPEGGIH